MGVKNCSFTPILEIYPIIQIGRERLDIPHRWLLLIETDRHDHNVAGRVLSLELLLAILQKVHQQIIGKYTKFKRISTQIMQQNLKKHCLSN